MPDLSCSYLNPQGLKRCPLPPWALSKEGLCLLHDSDPEKPVADFEALLQSKMERRDFHFEGTIFPSSLPWKEKVFPEFVNFENCRFLGKETNFYRASFKKGALFNGAVFKGAKTNFSKARFEGDFGLFSGTLFESTETIFAETSFLAKHLGFASAKFTGNRLDFKQARFQGSIFLSQCHFLSTFTSFEKAEWGSGPCSFAGSVFEGEELRFNEASFGGDSADFSGGRFACERIFFDEARLRCPRLNFSGATFEGRRVSFQNAEFDFENLNFVQATFKGRELDFSELRFLGGTADFSNATFESNHLKFYPLTLNNRTTTFNQCEFTGDEKSLYIVNPNRNDLSFQGVFFHGGRTKLKGDLHAASFIDTSLDNVDLNEAHWESRWGRLVCRDEVDANRADTPAHYRKAADVCRSLKKRYENFGNYETAGDFYYGEMECKRKLSPRRSWSGLQFMRITSGYGEKPVRVIFTSLLVILGCALLYLFGGVKTPSEIIKIGSGSGFTRLFYDFLNCIYFSVVSFTTLGYGDYHPVSWSRVVGASEGFTGAFFMAMFVLTVGRKMNR